MYKQYIIYLRGQTLHLYIPSDTNKDDVEQYTYNLCEWSQCCRTINKTIKLEFKLGIKRSFERWSPLRAAHFACLKYDKPYQVINELPSDIKYPKFKNHSFKYIYKQLLKMLLT